jgi:hypothetical protein
VVEVGGDDDIKQFVDKASAHATAPSLARTVPIGTLQMDAPVT